MFSGFPRSGSCNICKLDETTAIETPPLTENIQLYRPCTQSVCSQVSVFTWEKHLLLAATPLVSHNASLARGPEEKKKKIKPHMKAERWKGLLTPVLQIRSTCRQRRYDNYDNINCYSACLPLKVCETNTGPDQFQAFGHSRVEGRKTWKFTKMSRSRMSDAGTYKGG